MPSKTVLIGMPCGSGFVPSAMVQSMLQLHKPLPCAFMIIERQAVVKARNAIALEALRVGADYLLFVDDDNPIPPDTLERMIADDKDIVIAPILGRVPDDNGKHPLCAFYAETVQADGEPLRIYRNIEQFRDEGPLHRIDAGGTGCMLIKRRVLEVLFDRYNKFIFENGDIKLGEAITVDGAEYDRRTMSEDCEFCERASDAGFEIWLDERIKPFHITSYNLIQWRATDG